VAKAIGERSEPSVSASYVWQLRSPRSPGRRPKQATQILTRRIKQAISEWYVVNMLELSWDGFREHTRQGWNIGKPPYGYAAERHPHPVKAKPDDGKAKTRLVPDRDRGPVVTQIFQWRALELLSAQDIADRLNADPDRYLNRPGFHAVFLLAASPGGGPVGRA
jgi:hypothetical protein